MGKSLETTGGSVKLETIEKAFKSANALLLLDDAFSSMDSFQKREGFDLIRKEVNEKNLTAVFATSNYDDIMMLCDGVSVLVDGESSKLERRRTFI